MILVAGYCALAPITLLAAAPATPVPSADWGDLGDAAAPTLYFIHGLGSFADTETGVRLDAATGIASTKLSYKAAGMWADNWAGLLAQTAGAPPSSIFVGESMGGFFAAQLALQYGARCYLLNGTTDPSVQLQQFIGSPLRLPDGTMIEITPEIAASYKAAPDPRVPGMRKKFGLLISHGDTIVNPQDTIAYYNGWEAFQDWVYDSHSILKPESYVIMGQRIHSVKGRNAADAAGQERVSR